MSGGNNIFQGRVDTWMSQCFGDVIANDRIERNHRFIEESLELVQSCGCTASEAHQLVDYVFARPIGAAEQEVGGVMVTLAALCSANRLSMADAGEIELRRIWTKIVQIRAKQAAKPRHGPLPVTEPSALDEARAIIAELVDCKDLKEWIAAERHRLSLGCRVDAQFHKKYDDYLYREPLAWEAARAWDAKQK